MTVLPPPPRRSLLLPSRPARRWAGGVARRPQPVAQLQQEQNSAATEQSASPVIQAIVGVATAALRLAGVGRNDPATSVPPGPIEALPVGSVQGVMDAIREDYEQRAYFITGVITDAVYDEACYFADPTVKFSGRELWKRNLQLLVPFLDEPSIALKSIERLPAAAAPPAAGSVGGAVLRANWLLTTGLRLPWRPYIVVNGSTEYRLHEEDNNRVVSHVESWDISGARALALVFTPGEERRRASK